MTNRNHSRLSPTPLITGEMKKSMQFKDGKLHGEIKGWYRNGQMQLQAFFEDGKPIKKWSSWDKVGKLTNTIEH